MYIHDMDQGSFVASAKGRTLSLAEQLDCADSQ